MLGRGVARGGPGTAAQNLFLLLVLRLFLLLFLLLGGLGIPNASSAQVCAFDAWHADLAVHDEAIAALRRGDFTLRFTSSAGALDGLEFDLELRAHEFPFGGSLNSQLFDESDPVLGERCLSAADELFNVVVDEHKFKWKPTEPAQGDVDFTDHNVMTAWAGSHGKKIRHHSIFWSNPAQNPGWLDGYCNPADIANFIAAGLDRIDYVTADGCSGAPSCVPPDSDTMTSIDVVNEMIYYDYYRGCVEETGYGGIIKDIHNAVKANLPDARLYLNEHPPHHLCLDGSCDGLSWSAFMEYMISGYVDFVTEVAAAGVPFDGLALQSHYGLPPGVASIAQLVSDLEYIMDESADRLRAGPGIDMPYFLSELDYASPDVCDRAEFLARFYSMAFASPSVEGILYWGWLFSADTALYTSECYPNAAGKVVRDLVLQKWRTEIVDQAVFDGEAPVNAFYGTYDLQVKQSGKLIHTETIELARDGPQTIVVVLAPSVLLFGPLGAAAVSAVLLASGFLLRRRAAGTRPPSVGAGMA